MIHSGREARLAPITTEAVVSVNDMVTRTLREAILQAKFRPGERLLQDHLAEELRVSRQPVREALRRLESEGLLIRMPGRSVMVREYSEQEIRENYHLRELLEAEAARLAAERIQASELQELKLLNRTIAAAAASGETWRFLEANARFHRVIHASTRLPTLVRLINQLWIGHAVYTPLLVPGRAAQSVEEHQAIIAALEAHDPGEAAARMRVHIEKGAAEYFGSNEHRGK